MTNYRYQPTPPEPNEQSASARLFVVIGQKQATSN